MRHPYHFFALVLVFILGIVIGASNSTIAQADEDTTTEQSLPRQKVAANQVLESKDIENWNERPGDIVVLKQKNNDGSIHYETWVVSWRSQIGMLNTNKAGQVKTLRQINLNNGLTHCSYWTSELKKMDAVLIRKEQAPTYLWQLLDNIGNKPIPKG